MPKTSKLVPALLALLMLAAAPLAQAQWKWRDASGKVQYSDLPPPQGTPDADILQRPPAARRAIEVRALGAAASQPASAPASAPRAPGRAELEAQAKQKQAEAEAAKKQKEDERKAAEQRAENCKRAQAQLALLDDGVRITRRNEAGENIVLDERQRDDERRRTRAVIAADCR